MPTKFRFRWIPFLAATIAAAVGITLGQWQTRRAAEKEAIESTMSARQNAASLTLDGSVANASDLEYRRVRLKGTFVPGWTVYLDNRPYKTVAGFHVLMPMKIAGSDLHVLIARGWAKRDVAERTKLPQLPTPEGPIEIEGIARRSAGHVLQLGSAEPLRPGAIVQNINIEELARTANLRMQPFIIEQTSDANDGLVRDWPRPSSGIDKHRGYAFQWYALAATAMLFFVVTGFRSGRK